MTRKMVRRITSAASAALVMVVAVWLLAAGWGGRLDPRSCAVASLAAITYPAALICAAATAVAVAVLRRWKLLALLAMALLATWPTFHVNAPLTATRTQADSTQSFSVLTFNVMGFGGGGNDSVSATMQYILSTNADMVLLQEAALGPKDFLDKPNVVPLADEVRRRYPYHSHGYHDLIIMSRWPYTVLADTTLRQGFGSLDDIHSEYHFYAKAFDVDVPGHQLRLIAVHLQSLGLDDDDRNAYRSIARLDSVRGARQLKQVRLSLVGKFIGACKRRAGEAHQLRAIIDESPPNLMLCGDFNDVPASYTYWTVRGGDMRDAWADAGRGLTYTFNRDMMLFHIDHVLYRGQMRAVAITRDKAGTSDHYPLLTTMQWTQQSAP